jgi:lipopolysaccharide biosynthesis glycosyltransferase
MMSQIDSKRTSRFGALHLLLACALAVNACLLMFPAPQKPGIVFDVAKENKVGTSETGKRQDVAHVMYGISGNAEGFFSELEISLKSILMNNPLNFDLMIHFIADDLAYDALGPMFEKTGIAEWKTHNQVTLKTYNVGKYKKAWAQEVQSFQGNMGHSLGAYFRLMAFRVLPSSVEHVIYLDTDVIVMARLDALWTLRDSSVAFQWGKIQNSGFMLLNMKDMPKTWDLMKGMDWQNMIKILKERGVHDQMMFQAINYTQPNLVGTLPQAWDISTTSLYNGQLEVRHRPDGAGSLHYNGGAYSTKTAFGPNNTFLNSEKHKSGWGIGNYYVNIPWTWAKFVVESHLAGSDHTGNVIAINYNHTAWHNASHA